MSRLPVIVLGLVLPVAAFAQEESLTVEAWIGDFRAWLAENVEADTFESLGLDADGVDAGLGLLQDAVTQQPLDAEPPSRADAETLIDALGQFEMTQEGSAWLRSLLEARPPDTPSEIPSTGVVRPPVERRDPLRATWDQRLANRPPPSRAADYLPSLKAVFAEEGVPPELVWIAEVESSFNPTAHSRVGAVGLFQLMPDTAEELGLSINLFEDERRDPEKSARAAARYLRALRRQFQDWPLALAAYNAGPGRVAYLLSRLGQTSFAGIAHRLPEETQHYVPKVEATVWIREGVELRNLPAESVRAPVTAPPSSGNPGPGRSREWVTPPVGGAG